MVKGKTIVVGVCGGIAAYKAVDLVSRLKKVGADVHVIMTEAATKFVTPLTFQTMSANPVTCNTFNTPSNWNVAHVSLAERADLFVIAPATANMIGKIAGGIADDMLSTTIMAAKCPIIIAPAMNVNMYENPIVQNNIEKLTSLGYIFIEPEVGRLACGTSGKGRLAPNDQIVETIEDRLFDKKDLAGLNILVTAGPTNEYLDPVRFISNPSSGKMGYEIARAAKQRGACVTLITGPTNITPPLGVNIINIVSALEMYDRVMENLGEANMLIKAAAVADFRPKATHAHKLKKEQIENIELERNPDILQSACEVKGDKVIIGFCMETRDLVNQAYDKLIKKGADLIIANNVSEEGAGFGSDTNTALMIYPDGNIEPIENISKYEMGHIILDRGFGIYQDKHTDQNNGENI